MTSILPPPLQIPNPFPFTLPASLNPKNTLKPSLSPHPPRSASDDGKPPAPPDASGIEDSEFEDRLSQMRIRYRSGTGKKAELRRARKSGGGGGGGKKGKGVMLPPVPLREAVTVGGEKVEVGFTPYSERINGRIAGLGLAAVVLVELGSGKGILSYHSPPVLLIQIYTIIAVSALFIKFEKERISVWPKEKILGEAARREGRETLSRPRSLLLPETLACIRPSPDFPQNPRLCPSPLGRQRRDHGLQRPPKLPSFSSFLSAPARNH